MHIHIILVLLPEMDTDNVLQYRAILYKWSNGKKVYFNFSIPTCNKYYGESKVITKPIVIFV